MSTKSSKSSRSVKSSNSSNQKKLARYGIDILAVYSSTNEVPVELDVAMAKLQELYMKKNDHEKPHVKKCTMQIWCKDREPHTIVIKSHNTKQIFESFSVRSMGTPQVGQMSTQSLVFLPVLNKNYKSELFVFHPNDITAQELVIKLVKLKQIKEVLYQKSLPGLSPTPPKSEQGEIPRPIVYDQTDRVYKKENNDPDDIRSEYSLSSTFFNNWYSKVENMVNMSPSSLYQSSGYSQSINGLQDELAILNHHLKEIRMFMNNLYILMNSAMNEMKTPNGNTQHLLKLPSKSIFIEVIQKIRSSLNIAASHEFVIENPPAIDIVNQLLLMLRIIGDATKEKNSSRTDLLLGIKEPYINSTTVAYLANNLNVTNKAFWMSLGEVYGYVDNVYPIGLQRTVIDEFQIRRDLLHPTYEPNNDRINYKTLDQSYERNHPRKTDQESYNNGIVRSYERNLDGDYSRSMDRRFERNINRNIERTSLQNNEVRRSFERFPFRNDYESKEYRRKESSDEELYSERNYRKMSLSQPQLHHVKVQHSAPTFDYDSIHRSHSPMYEGRIPHLPDPGIMMHQRSSRGSPNHNCHIHSNTSTWNDRQCRFIDAVQLRNGRLMKIVRDRSAQNKREISVSANELIEFMENHGDMFLARNALGEVGLCPYTIAERVTLSR